MASRATLPPLPSTASLGAHADAVSNDTAGQRRERRVTLAPRLAAAGSLKAQPSASLQQQGGGETPQDSASGGSRQAQSEPVVERCTKGAIRGCPASGSEGSCQGLRTTIAKLLATRDSGPPAQAVFRDVGRPPSASGRVEAIVGTSKPSAQTQSPPSAACDSSVQADRDDTLGVPSGQHVPVQGKITGVASDMDEPSTSDELDQKSGGSSAPASDDNSEQGVSPSTGSASSFDTIATEATIASDTQSMSSVGAGSDGPGPIDQQPDNTRHQASKLARSRLNVSSQSCASLPAERNAQAHANRENIPPPGHAVYETSSAMWRSYLENRATGASKGFAGNLRRAVLQSKQNVRPSAMEELPAEPSLEAIDSEKKDEPLNGPASLNGLPPLRLHRRQTVAQRHESLATSSSSASLTMPGQGSISLVASSSSPAISSTAPVPPPAAAADGLDEKPARYSARRDKSKVGAKLKTKAQHVDPRLDGIGTGDSRPLQSLLESAEARLLARRGAQSDQDDVCCICLEVLPTKASLRMYFSCCSRDACAACGKETVARGLHCPLCRCPRPKTDKEYVDRIRQNAESGRAVAQCELGVLYLKGYHGLPQSDLEARRWFEAAGEQGFAPAQYMLGCMHQRGHGGLAKPDPHRAVRFWMLAASQGDVEAQFNLGMSYYRGEGVPACSERATLLLNQAAAQGHAEAKALLKRMGPV
eukprot:TRINITY_DN40565_c0_g1_i2.p1 TRINITY_DN40565_c0_g1~~TRINITY_DN40565_c0_g1_i2.p1  ORF type:complete len:704 (+),score=106.73 TRINITY_DN40565_c0_g1_i2:190-2301(+)